MMNRQLAAPDQAGSGAENGQEIRCDCGSLLARRTDQGIELKCRRCRRSLLLRLAPDGAITVEEV